MAGLIALLTDFGYSDYYVAALKGVIKSLAPEADFIDVTHGVEPFSVWEGAFSLYYAFKFMPEGTTILAVVDPGVGTSREIIAARCKGKWLVGPNNGLLYPVLRDNGYDELFAVDVKAFETSRTFQGRDVMAKVSAKLAGGQDVSNIKLGGVKLKKLRGWGFVSRCRSRCKGKVMHVDRFGNLISNLRSDGFAIRGKVRVSLDDKTLDATYSENYSKGGFIVVPGGYGLIELAVGKGSAASQLQAKAGSVISFEKV